MIVESKRLQIVLTRDEYRRLTQDLTDQIIECLDRTIREASIQRDTLLELIPIGGGSQLFCVLEALEAYFGKPLSNLTDPHHAVAKGAALIGWEEEGSVLTPEGVRLPASQHVYRDVTAHAIGVLALDNNDEERFTTILTKGVPMPSEFTKMFLISEEGATAACIKIMQGQMGDKLGDCTLLGEFQLTELQPVFGQPHKIEVGIKIDQNGLLTATARDSIGGKTADLQVSYETAAAI